MTTEQEILAAMAAQSFEMAASFAKAGMLADARHCAHRANEQLDQVAAAAPRKAVAKPETPIIEL